MSISAIRHKLHNYLEVADDKKVKALYVMVEDEIEKSTVQYNDDFKKELDRRYAYYKSGGKMVTATEANKQIQEIVKKGRKK
ncbi:MAG: hypothetical protein ABIP79_17990 [Chitinophagaceae bacterium]